MSVPYSVLTTRKRPICGVKHLHNSVPKEQCEVAERAPISCGSGKGQDGRRRSNKKNNKRKNKRAANRKGVQKKNGVGVGQLKVEAVKMNPGGLALSKSENNIFEKSSKLSVEGGSRFLSGYEGVVTSMRDLQLDSGDEQSPTRTMNDFSRTQVLNMIAVSREVVGCEGGGQFEGSCECNLLYLLQYHSLRLVFVFSPDFAYFSMHLLFCSEYICCAYFIHVYHINCLDLVINLTY